MALKKTYTIEIQMDAARNALADANKRLAELDASLEGLDRDSDAAKAIIAEMAKAAKEVEQLTDEVGGLGNALDNLKPGTIGALKKQAQDLEQALEGALAGSADADALIAELGRVKAQIKDIDESVDVAFSRDKAGALVDAVNGLAGAFTIATVAAQNFGLTEQDAEKYNQKLLEMLSIVSSLEQIHKLTTGEVSTALKGLVGDAKKVVLGYFGIGTATTSAGTAAVTSANVTRLALASLGIGLILIALGLVVSNWDKITAAVKRNKEAVTTALLFIMPPIGLLLKGLTAIEKKFGSLSALASGVAAAFKQGFSTLGDEIAALLEGDFAGAAKLYENRGRAVAEAFDKGVRERNDELLEERARELLKRRAMENEQRLKVVEAEGRDTAALEDKIFRERIASLDEKNKEEKAEKDKIQTEYAAFLKAQARKRIEEQQAAELAALNAQLSLIQAGGKDAFDLQEKIKRRELAFLLAAPQKNLAAIIAKEGEISTIRELARQKLAQREYEAFKERTARLGDEQLKTIEELRAEWKKVADEITEQAGKAMNVGRINTDLPEQVEKVLTDTQAAVASKPLQLGDKILVGLFGVKPETLDYVKEQIGQAVATISASVQDVAAGLLSQATADADARLFEVQNRLSLLDQQLSQRTAAAEDTEAKLATAQGTRREFLLLKLRKEREEEEKTRAARARAAKEEQQALKERHRLEVQGQKITAASTLAASAYNAVLAIQAALEAVKQGSKMPFPLNIVAVVAALAAVTSTVVAARGLGKTLKLASGGKVVGPGGPKDDLVPAWLSNGEYVMNAAATAKFLPELERMNSLGRVQVLPPTAIRRAEGGPVSPGLAATTTPALPAGTMLVREADLAELLAYTRAVATNTATLVQYGPPRLGIGQREALEIDQQREDARRIQVNNQL